MSMHARTFNAVSIKLLKHAAMREGWLQRVRAAIEEDGRSLRTISEAAGLGPNYVSEMLRGKEPGVDKLVRLAQALGVSASYLVTGLDMSAEHEEALQRLTRLSPEKQRVVLDLIRSLPTPE